MGSPGYHRMLEVSRRPSRTPDAGNGPQALHAKLSWASQVSASSCMGPCAMPLPSGATSGANEAGPACQFLQRLPLCQPQLAADLSLELSQAHAVSLVPPGSQFKAGFPGTVTQPRPVPFQPRSVSTNPQGSATHYSSPCTPKLDGQWRISETLI